MTTKVFVGNLSFKTRENELAEEFETAGKVIKANIITRGPRSLGYGFVEMADEAAAANAVKVMNKKVIDGRQINVEFAKVRTPGERPKRERPPRARGRRPRRGPRSASNNPTAPAASGPNAAATAAAPAPAANAPATDGAAAPPRSRRPRRPRRPRRRPAATGEQRKPAPRKTSTPTSLFVANLPFAVDDARLAEIFGEFKQHIRSAHVVVKANGRSKGFGFVDFDTTEAQHAALKAVDKKVVDGRELSVKIAIVNEAAAGNATNTTAAPANGGQH